MSCTATPVVASGLAGSALLGLLLKAVVVYTAASTNFLN
jgi:hypothetical protein